MATEPTIVVKKADGTTVRMPLSQVKKMHAEKKKSAAAPSTKHHTHTSHAPKTKPPEAAPKTVDATVAPAKPDEFSEPYEPLPPVVEKKASPVPPARENEVTNVIKRLKFSVPDNAQPRLRSVIQLKLKDVRSVEQTIAIATRPFAAGGLGLTNEKAQELLSACLESELPMKLPPSVAKPRPMQMQPLKPIVPIKQAVVNVPAATPVTAVENAFTYMRPASRRAAEEAAAAAQGIPALIQTTKPQTSAVKINEPILKSGAIARPPMIDIHAPVAEEVSPVDEIRLFTLTDLRRLSPNPAEASARLIQKFNNLKAESILLFLDAIEAWHQCPLYKSYVGLISEALNSRRPLGQLTSRDPNAIQMSEIEALVAMQQMLAV